MKVEEIEIHAGMTDFPFQSIRRLEAKCEAPTNFSKAPSMSDVNQKLREMASSVGANAVIEVRYESGATLTSFRSIRGFGLAVTKLSDDMPCPECAETIKRAAKHCRFCRAEIPESARTLVTQPGAHPNNSDQSLPTEPLRSSDNMPTIVMVIIGALLGLALISSM
jgi:hypothetical protein